MDMIPIAHRRGPGPRFQMLALMGASTLLGVACGGSGDSSSKSPVLQIYGSVMDSRGGFDVAETSMMVNLRLEPVGTLNELDGPATAYILAPEEPPSNEVDRLMSIFGIEAPLEPQISGGLQAGSNDGSAPTFTLVGDAAGSWTYVPPLAEVTSNPSCEDASGFEPVAPPTPVNESVVVDDTLAPQLDGEGNPIVEEVDDPCEQESAPQDLPSTQEALEMFSDLMSDIGVDVDELDVEVFSDDYGSAVTGYLRIDGIRSPLTWTVSYGEAGRISFANGTLGTPEKFAEYDRIGTSAGIDRFNADQSAAVDQAMGESTGEVSVARIIDVEEELVMLYAVDGSAYLVPGYAFVSEQDEMGYAPRYVVSALPAEFVEEAMPPTSEDSFGVDNGSSGEIPGDPGSGGFEGGDMEEITSEEANTLLGMNEAEAGASAEANGWVVRVAARDGEQFALTMDYNPLRVNLTVDNGVVTDVFVG